MLTALEQDPCFFPWGFDQCLLQYVKWSPQTLTALQEGVFGHENKTNITPRLLSLITASLHALFVCLLPWAAFQRWAVSKNPAELFIWGKHAGFSPYTHRHQKIHFQFLCFTSNFCLCNKQVLNPGLSHLEQIRVPAPSPPQKVSLKPQRHPGYFHISGSDSAKPLDMCFSLTGLGGLSRYWSAGLHTMKCGSLKCPPTAQPGAAASVYPCSKGSVIHYINRTIIGIVCSILFLYWKEGEFNWFFSHSFSKKCQDSLTK